MNGLQSPHKLLNKYLEGHITCPPGDTGHSFTLGEPDLISVVDVGGFDWDRLQLGLLFFIPLLVHRPDIEQIQVQFRRQ